MDIELSPCDFYLVLAIAVMGFIQLDQIHTILGFSEYFHGPHNLLRNPLWCTLHIQPVGFDSSRALHFRLCVCNLRRRHGADLMGVGMPRL